MAVTMVASDCRNVFSEVLLSAIFCFLAVACGDGSRETAPAPTFRDASSRMDEAILDRAGCPAREVGPGDLRFCGVIDEATIAKFGAALNDEINRVVITSPGGREDLAMDLFNRLEASNVRLVFEGYCNSACAHFLFLPAKGPIVLRGTLIGFHQTNASQAMLRARPDLPDHDRFVALAVPAINRAVDFYAARGLHRAWLVEPTLQTKPTCVVADIDWSDPDYPVLGYQSVYELWMPSSSMIKRLGRGPFEGDWPETREDVQAIMNGVGRAIGVGKVFFGGPPKFTTDFTAISELPVCPS
jgi:hypothetical protein